MTIQKHHVAVLVAAALMVYLVVTGGIVSTLVILGGVALVGLLLSFFAMALLDVSGLGCVVKRWIAERFGYTYTPGPYDDCQRWEKK